MMNSVTVCHLSSVTTTVPYNSDAAQIPRSIGTKNNYIFIPTPLIDPCYYVDFTTFPVMSK